MTRNKKSIALLVLFLFINFGGLALGSFLMNNGPLTDWYLNLDKAPWTPPGWIFGVAWFTIMLCFSFYLVKLFEKTTSKKIILYIFQVLLNVVWNYVFFNKHLISIGFLVITILTALIFYFFFTYKKETKKSAYLLLPYMTWLCIATSLNLYILVHN